MTRMSEWGAYPRVLREILDSVKEPDTEIHMEGIAEVGGVGEQYRYLEFIETAELLRNAHHAEAEGYDAFLIGDIADPGLHEAREAVDIPVLGLCESALHVACMMGASFSLVTINPKFTPRIVENVRRYGLRDRMASVERMNVERLLDLGECFDDAPSQVRVLKQFNEAAARTAQDGTEVVIAAADAVMALLAHVGINETAVGAPILNGITNLVKMSEMVVRLNRLMGGRFTSRIGTYAAPPASQIEELRRFYSPEIFPFVKPPGQSPRR